MSVSKDKITAGTKCVVNPKKEGLNDTFFIMPAAGDGLSAKPLKKGDVFEILGKPKIFNGIKSVKVDYNGLICWAYYTHVRFAADEYIFP